MPSVGSSSNSKVDAIMAAMEGVNTNPPVNLQTRQKKDFVVEVKSGDNPEDLQKIFQKQLDELSQ